MKQLQRQTRAVEVAACTIVAAHRRDHRHQTADECHPHVVEVVHLGLRAVMICHDCCTDSGFVAHREAGQLAEQHRQLTRADAANPPAGPGTSAA